MAHKTEHMKGMRDLPAAGDRSWTDFTPSLAPETGGGQGAWWFAFRGYELLVRADETSAQIPFAEDPGDLGLSPGRRHYLGTLGGQPSYVVDCGLDAVPPEGMDFFSLRRLFGLLDEGLFRVAGYASQILNWDEKSRFCGRCGNPTATKLDERAKICPGCGHITYPRISPAIIVAVVRGDRLLLAHAPRFPGKFYSVLAGFVEPGETLEECLRREVREEVGIEVKNVRYFGSQSWPFPNSLMVGFTAEHAEGGDQGR